MTPDKIPTQPEPDHIARAGDLLDAVLAGVPDMETHLAVAAALAHLYDVHPPYPPHPEPDTSLHAETGIQQALQQLSHAARRPGSLEEGLRIAHAIHELRTLTPPDRPQPDASRP